MVVVLIIKSTDSYPSLSVTPLGLTCGPSVVTRSSSLVHNPPSSPRSPFVRSPRFPRGYKQARTVKNTTAYFLPPSMPASSARPGISGVDSAKGEGSGAEEAG